MNQDYKFFAEKDFRALNIQLSHLDDLDDILVKCHETCEKYLKDVIRHEPELEETDLNTHSIVGLINSIRQVYPDFVEFRQYGFNLQGNYFTKRYPGKNYVEAEIEDVFTAVSYVIKLRNRCLKIINRDTRPIPSNDGKLKFEERVEISPKELEEIIKMYNSEISKNAILDNNVSPIGTIINGQIHVDEDLVLKIRK